MIFYLKDNLVLKITKKLVLRVPPIQVPTQNGKMKIFLCEFYPRTNLTAFCLVSWYPETKQNTQNFEIQVPEGTFRLSWPKNGFIVFRRYDLVEKSVVRFILGRNFFNNTSNLNFALGLYGK
jgi:hypothetical protein